MITCAIPAYSFFDSPKCINSPKVILDKEINTLENYLELQRIRYSGKFDYRIQIADEIDIDSIKFPPMLVQPFIVNAIEHGIKHRETPDNSEMVKW